MKKLIVLLALSALIGLTGCVGPTLTVDGRTYRILSAEEELTMLNYARSIMMQAPNFLTPQQKAYVGMQTPIAQISYTGNRSGRAVYEWHVSEQIAVKLVFTGEFLSSHTQYKLEQIDLAELNTKTKAVKEKTSLTNEKASFELGLPPRDDEQKSTGQATDAPAELEQVIMLKKAPAKPDDASAR